MAGIGTDPAVTQLLRPFWVEAEVPRDRWLYYEFQGRRYGSIAQALAALGPWSERRVLDLGGGIGGLSVLLHARLGGQFELAEYAPPSSAHRAALAKRGVVAVHQIDLSRPTPLAALPRDYDAILLVEVLEHLLTNPLLLFREIWDHLVPGGLLFLTTPNMARLHNRWQLLRGRSIKEAGRYPWDGAGVYGHVIEFTLDELDLLAAAESFQRVAAEIVQQVPSVAPSRRQQWGVRLLNRPTARRLRLGDDILASYRKTPRQTNGACPVPLDGAGRL
jgi:2-polyprenyl-3-methyl-5-hydroxy-6-metoxy-1,4-benzoquinol methylase